MANPYLMWVRDECLVTADIGDTDNYGAFVFDLLWKARTGQPQPGATLLSLPQVVNSPKPTGSAVAPALGQSPGPLAIPPDLPSQDLTGAYVKRIRLTIQPYFAPALGDSAGNHNLLVSQGHWEGIMVMPLTTSNWRVQPTHQGPRPGDPRGMVQWDWLHFQRVLMLEEGMKSSKMFPTAIAANEQAYSHSIDTRCSRRISELGSTLCFVLSGADGFTINGFYACWSILLHLPS